MPRPLLHHRLPLGFACLLVLGPPVQANPDARGAVEAARRQTGAVFETIAGAAAPSATAAAKPDRSSLGVNLGEYAANAGGDPAHFESFAEAARRILANGTTQKRAPDATSRWLDDAAAALAATIREVQTSAEALRDPRVETTLDEARAAALLARFHARRMIAAVHYNLFLRGLRLAELVAATYTEKDAVALWRQLVTTCAADPRAGEWRAELRRLEVALKELEAQCCPPDEAVMKEQVWQPAR